MAIINQPLFKTKWVPTTLYLFILVSMNVYASICSTPPQNNGFSACPYNGVVNFLCFPATGQPSKSLFGLQPPPSNNFVDLVDNANPPGTMNEFVLAWVVAQSGRFLIETTGAQSDLAANTVMEIRDCNTGVSFSNDDKAQGQFTSKLVLDLQVGHTYYLFIENGKLFPSPSENFAFDLFFSSTPTSTPLFFTHGPFVGVYPTRQPSIPPTLQPTKLLTNQPTNQATLKPTPLSTFSPTLATSSPTQPLDLAPVSSPPSEQASVFSNPAVIVGVSVGGGGFVALVVGSLALAWVLKGRKRNTLATTGMVMNSANPAFAHDV